MEKSKAQIPKDKQVKPSLAWNLKDYLATNEEPPACVLQGRTEGEAMDRDQAIDWITANTKFLRVFKEDYPEKFDDEMAIFIADLEYLTSIGKITADEKESLLKPETFIFEEPK